MCYLIRCYLAWPHEQGRQPASAWAHYKPSPFLALRFRSLSPLLPPSIPLSVLPMNVSISLPMCKLFSPALRADGEQCLCRDFLCMSFLIRRRVTRFPCSLLAKRWACMSMHTHTTYMHKHALAICNQYARCVVGMWGYWHNGGGDRVHYVNSPY